MRANVPEYELLRPRTLDEALALLSDAAAGWKPFAGGTDIMVGFETGRLAHRRWVSIFGLPELRGIEVTEQHVAIGAGATFTEVRAHDVLSSEFAMLGQAASETGAIAIQNRGTIGGNIANASPAADTPPALLAYGALLEIASTNGRRMVAYADFHTGYKKMLLLPSELIARVLLPRLPASTRVVDHYRKVGTRKAQAITKVGLAARAVLPSAGRPAEVRIGLTSVGPVTVLARRTGAVLAAALDKGAPLDDAVIRDARAAIAEDATPIDDVRSTGRYRKLVLQNLAEEWTRKLATAAVS